MAKVLQDGEFILSGTNKKRTLDEILEVQVTTSTLAAQPVKEHRLKPNSLVEGSPEFIYLGFM